MLSEANIRNYILLPIKYFEIKLQMEALICEREGMVAENTQRQTGGYSGVYGSDDFFDLEKRFEELRKTLVGLLESG